MFFNVYHGIYYIVLVSTALAALWVLPKVRSPFSLLAILIIITLSSELLAKYVVLKFAVSNNMIYHFFTPLEFLLYTRIYAVFLKNRKWNLVLWCAFLFICLAEIINSIYFQPLHHTNTNIMMLESVMLVFFSLILFLYIKDSMIYENLLKEGIFWFNSGVLIYYSFNILVWGFHSFKVYTFTNPPVIIYQLNLLFSAFLYINYTYCLYLDIEAKKQSLQIGSHGS